MSEIEQAAEFLRLKKQSGELQNEIAALDANLKKAGADFKVLADQLIACNVTCSPKFSPART